MLTCSTLLFLAAAASAPAPQSGVTRRVSLGWLDQEAVAPCESPVISGNGRFVVFVSTDPSLVLGDTNGVQDVFLRDVVQGTISRISVNSAGGEANGASFSPSISVDGNRVAFHSEATNLVPGDANGVMDVFLRDVPTTSTRRVSVTHLGAEALGGDSVGGVVAGDGNAVAFRSWATNLPSAPDGNGMADVFLWTASSGGAERVSLSSAGGDPNQESIGAAISFDGRYVAFYSKASNLTSTGVDTNNAFDVFVRDTVAGSNKLISRSSSAAIGNGDSSLPSISGDGRYVAFRSLASNLVAGDTNGATDVFRRDLNSGVTVRASVTSGGVEGNSSSSEPALSLDGRFLAFESQATNLVAGDTNALRDVFLRDVQLGQTSRVSVSSSGSEADQVCVDPSLDSNGGRVAFESAATNLVAGDTNLAADAFVRDRGPASPVLAVTGSCPGTMTLIITGATPGNWVAIFHGHPGVTTLATPPCAGTQLDLAQAVLGALVRTNGAGKATRGFIAASGACGRSVQVLDGGNCSKSNVIVL